MERVRNCGDKSSVSRAGTGAGSCADGVQDSVGDVSTAGSGRLKRAAPTTHQGSRLFEAGHILPRHSQQVYVMWVAGQANQIGQDDRAPHSDGSARLFVVPRLQLAVHAYDLRLHDFAPGTGNAGKK
jgi:hypothetical protein